MKNDKILLIEPTTRGSKASEGGTGDDYKMAPYLGLAYIAAVLERNGYIVKVVDMYAYRTTLNELKKIINDIKPGIVGLTARTCNILDAYNVAKLVKQLDEEILVVLGGAHCTALPQRTLNECKDIDIAVMGEGEETFLEIVRSDRKRFEFINGIYYRLDCQILNTSPRSKINDLDVLPYPAWHLYNLSEYNKRYSEKHKKFVHELPIVGSRGCPYPCQFCFPLLGRNVNYRSIEHVVDEIEYNINKFNVENFYFEDSTSTIRKERFIGLCDLMIKRGLNNVISWGFETRIDLVDEGILDKAKEAGCDYLFFGIESGDDRILKAMKKNINAKQIREAVKLAKQTGIQTINASFILGFPYETRESITNTITLSKTLDIDMANFQLVDIYPGTDLWSMADNGEGGIRWIDGKRYNWEAYSRDSCMTEVNDLSAEDLQNLRNKALREFKKTKIAEKGYFSILKRKWAYLVYYIKNDPLMVAKKIYQKMADLF